MSSPATPLAAVRVRALNCPNCGAAVELRGFAHTLSAVCPNCRSVLDTSTPEVKILQQVQGAMRVEPLIPLGSRAVFENTQFEVIGFQVRQTQGEDASSWSEYLLFNPYRGFRYLSEYSGHWNYIRVQSAIPEFLSPVGRRRIRLGGRTYRQFERSVASTVYVLGEFPWRVQAGETAQVEDYIAPPYAASSETTAGEAEFGQQAVSETVWSTAEYITGGQIWQAFGLPGSAPPASGIYMNQPSPVKGKAGSIWRTSFVLLAALVLTALAFAATAPNEQLVAQSFDTGAEGGAREAAFVSAPFTVSRRSRLAIDVRSAAPVFLRGALVPQEAARPREFTYDLTEGSRTGTFHLSSVPAGRYALRIEPEFTQSAARAPLAITVRRTGPGHIWFWLAAVALLIPPVFTTVRSGVFESARWRNADVGGGV